MAQSKNSIGILILQVAMSIFLIVSGILTLQLDSGFLGKAQSFLSGNEVANAVYSILKGDVATAVIVILGICEIIAGAFLFISIFLYTGKLTATFVYIIVVVWIVIIVLVDILGNGGLLKGAFNSTASCLSFFKSLASHLMVLGAMLTVSRKNQ